MKNKGLYSFYQTYDTIEILPLTDDHIITLRGDDEVLDFVKTLLDCYREGKRPEPFKTAVPNSNLVIVRDEQTS